MFSSVIGLPPMEMTRPTTRMAGGTPTLRKRSEAVSLTIAAKMLASSMAFDPLLSIGRQTLVARGRPPHSLARKANRRSGWGLPVGGCGLFYPIPGSRSLEKFPDELFEARAGHGGDLQDLLLLRLLPQRG